MRSSIPKTTQFKDAAEQRRESIFERKGSLFERFRRVGRDFYKGRGLAVFTSGGDSQGMNAAVRAVVRFSLFVGCDVFFIREGYQGMVDGGDHIEEANWSSVSSIINKGGTVIGSARCSDFRERPGRLKAARNLVERGITSLVVIGGDGSLTGADLFRLEWSDLLDELLKNGEIDKESREKYKYLHVAGLVGSIDNDFCGTDMTIGTDSALHRIMEAIDAITATASSHQRTFIMEVMGRRCGYLALVAANCSEADFVFLPEYPPPEDWPKILCGKLVEARGMGKRLNIVIVSEGALDRNGSPITSEMVKDIIVDTLNQDARVTVLGHVQRGGSPSVFDRILGCRLGCEAVMSLMEAKGMTDASVITINGNQVTRIPLVDCVERTKACGAALVDKDWDEAMRLRGPTFERSLQIYKTLASMRPTLLRNSKSHHTDANTIVGLTIAIVVIGTPACGMNAAIQAIVRCFYCPGRTVYGIRDGIDGLVDGRFEELERDEVIGWVGQGGAFLGCTRTLPKKKMSEVAARLEEFDVMGLIIIGGFEAYMAGLQMTEARPKYPPLCIPMVVIPASANNNIPGTDFSMGCDTAANEIMEICDRIRQASQGLSRHAFIIETIGGYCGYLATVGGMASGSDAAYIHEEEITVADVVRDVENLVAKMDSGIERGLLLKSDKVNDNFNTEFIHRLFSEQAKGKFTVTMNVIGQMQQGGHPSPFDRNMGIKFGVRTVDYLVTKLQAFQERGGDMRDDSLESAVMIGVVRRHYTFTPLVVLKPQTDFEQRIPKEQWWMNLRPLASILAKHGTAYRDLEHLSGTAWMAYGSETELTRIKTVSDIRL